jgi:isopentenyldiphosphate isomerase
MSFLDHIKRCNNGDLSQFEPWFIGRQRAGFIHRDFAPTVATRPDLFLRCDGTWHLDAALDTPGRRTAAVRAFLLELRERGQFGKLWREEAYPVARELTDPPLMAMERAAVPWFGVRASGPHMTGYVRRKDGLHIWVPRRSYTKPTFPGQLDNTVAGGQPMGIGLLENLIKECKEEAAIPEALAMQAHGVGAITYCMEAEDGLKPDVQFCYDLELPADFTPRNADGEIDEFMLWPIERVAEIVRDTREFKFNCNLVIIDFLVRHGLIAPEHPDYLEIVAGLRR